MIPGAAPQAIMTLGLRPGDNRAPKARRDHSLGQRPRFWSPHLVSAEGAIHRRGRGEDGAGFQPLVLFDG